MLTLVDNKIGTDMDSMGGVSLASPTWCLKEHKPFKRRLNGHSTAGESAVRGKREATLNAAESTVQRHKRITKPRLHGEQ